MVLQQLDELTVRLESWVMERNWAAIGSVDELLRELVGRALADPDVTPATIERRLSRLRDLYRQAEMGVEGEKAKSGQDMSLARKSFHAARSYLAHR